jgi:hypothetical protein
VFRKGNLTVPSNNLKWTNQTADAPIIDTSTMVYIPLSKEGVLIAFAGADTTEKRIAFSNNCCYGTVSMATINIYDIASSTWYSVTATGSVPPQRMLPCSVVSASPDGSSFQIIMFKVGICSRVKHLRMYMSSQSRPSAGSKSVIRKTRSRAWDQ